MDETSPQNGSGDGKISQEEDLTKLFSYKRKFVVSLEDIKLKLDKPTQTRIVYNYPLVSASPEDFSTGIFLIKPETDESQTIGNDKVVAFWEHELDQKLNEETLKEHFKRNLLEIKLCQGMTKLA